VDDMLTNIRARNFKSLKDVTLDLGPRNVLVGANMAGKSNAIDLFRFIYDMTFPRQPGSGALSNAVFARGGFGEFAVEGGNEQLIGNRTFRDNSRPNAPIAVGVFDLDPGRGVRKLQGCERIIARQAAQGSPQWRTSLNHGLRKVLP